MLRSSRQHFQILPYFDSFPSEELARDGRVIRIEESIDSFVEVSDPDDKIESIIEEWLSKQG